nr:alpha/beta hydrolase-fold protein [Planosporangium thailandense]
MESSLTRDVTGDPLVGDGVAYAVLTPSGWTPDERLPLVLILHGANSSSEVLAALHPVIDALWNDGSLPRSVIASASTPTAGGFYLDHPGGGSWETFMAAAFPQLIERRYGIDPDRISLMGSSMGGYGALKIAFAEPTRWQAVAAIAPALLPANTPQELRPRNTLGVLAQLGTEMAGDGTDPRRFADNSVLHRLRANADTIRASALPIFLRCGDRDVFKLHDGTEQLHRTLWSLDIGHEYHLVFNADHIGPEGMAAQRAALTFIGAAQRAQAGEDRTDADRKLEAAWREWAAGGRHGTPPALDAYGVTGPTALRVLMEPELAEAARRDPTAERRFGRSDPARSTHPLRRDGFPEEHAPEAVLLCPMGLDVPASGVVGEVLGHRLIGVEPHLAHTLPACVVLGQGQQSGTDTPPLRARRDGDVLQEQVIRLRDEHGEADGLAVLHRHPDPALAYGLRVVGGHRCRGPADAGHVNLVRGDRHRPNSGDVVGYCWAHAEHRPRIGTCLKASRHVVAVDEPEPGRVNRRRPGTVRDRPAGRTGGPCGALSVSDLVEVTVAVSRSATMTDPPPAGMWSNLAPTMSATARLPRPGRRPGR